MFEIYEYLFQPVYFYHTEHSSRTYTHIFVWSLVSRSSFNEFPFRLKPLWNKRTGGAASRWQIDRLVCQWARKEFLIPGFFESFDRKFPRRFLEVFRGCDLDNSGIKMTKTPQTSLYFFASRCNYFPQRFSKRTCHRVSSSDLNVQRPSRRKFVNSLFRVSQKEVVKA